MSSRDACTSDRLDKTAAKSTDPTSDRTSDRTPPTVAKKAARMTAPIRLVSSDGQNFDAPGYVVDLSQTISAVLDDIGDDSDISLVPLPNVDGKTLALIIEQCGMLHRGDQEKLETSLRDAQTTSRDSIFEIIKAANYLNITALLKTACKSVAECIKGKTPEEVRQTFGIKNDFTPEEEEQMKIEKAWAFD